MDIDAIKSDLMSSNWFIQGKAMNLMRAIQNRDHPILIKYAEEQWLQAKADEKERGTTISRHDFENQRSQQLQATKDRIRKLAKLMVKQGKGKISKKDALQKAQSLIKETKKGYKYPVFAISKQEELEAVNTIKAAIVPLNVEKWKEYGSRETADQVRHKIRKVKIYKRQGTIRAIMYSTNDGPWWLIRKDRKGRMEILDNSGQSYRLDGSKSWKSDRSLDVKDVEYLHPDDGIDESKETPEHLRVTRKEEHEAVAFIKRVVIPYAVENWNKHSPQSWQLTTEQLIPLLKKFGLSNGPGGDIMVYTTSFTFAGSKKHQFVYRIYKSDLINRLTVGLISNLHKAGDRTWDV